jgi:alpha/beta hydrolase fold
LELRLLFINPPVDFKAKWETENSSLNTSSLKERIARCLFHFLLKPILYPGASLGKYFFIDKQKESRAREHLAKAGGVARRLQTPDGDSIAGTFLTAEAFQQKMSRYFERKTEGEESYWTLKEAYYTTEEGVKKPDSEGFKQVQELAEDCHLPLTVINDPQVKEPRFYAGPPSQGDRRAVILSHANAMISASYKSLAFYYLMRGFDVMLIDHRGYGKSGGAPSDKKCKLDYDTAFQYLRDKEKIPPGRIISHGHCLG